MECPQTKRWDHVKHRRKCLLLLNLWRWRKQLVEVFVQRKGVERLMRGTNLPQMKLSLWRRALQRARAKVHPFSGSQSLDRSSWSSWGHVSQHSLSYTLCPSSQNMLAFHMLSPALAAECASGELIHPLLVAVWCKHIACIPCRGPTTRPTLLGSLQTSY